MTVVVPDRPQIFERGDKVYITAPVQVFRPTDAEVEEYAFASQVKGTAPNDNLAWFQGQYVEADQANRNGAMWRAGELAIKALTPMLMPVTVMHDPRTAVGTIADSKLLTPDADSVQRARIETALALWAHRFPEAVEEARHNAEQGTLMQSMECQSPWYECSECGQLFHKLPGGQERASWCAHLKDSDPTGGYVDLAADRQTGAARILGGVCFTGTGLIYGSRGARGALPTAHLAEWQDEVAEYHERVHTDTRAVRSIRMGVVQIDEAELKLLRDERDSAKTAATAETAKVADLTKKVEETEAAKTAAEERATAAEGKVTSLEEQANQAKLASDRLGALGSGFTAKLGDFTKSRLNEQAKSMSDEDWDNRLKELEETASVKRDAQKDGTTPERRDPDAPPAFEREELAGLIPSGDGGEPKPTGAPSRVEQSTVIGSLANAFRPKAKA